jgi:solute carrier family 36 (proton-coupled amino acid transporter)
MVEHDKKNATSEDVYRRNSVGKSGGDSGTGGLGRIVSPSTGNKMTLELTRIMAGKNRVFSTSHSDDVVGNNEDTNHDHPDALLWNPLMGQPLHQKTSQHHHHRDGLLLVSTPTSPVGTRIDNGHGSSTLPPGTASTIQVVINIIISFVGAGLLGIPYAMSKSGWFLGSICLLLVSGLNLYAMLLLPQVQKALVAHHGMSPEAVATYGDLGLCIIGRAGETLVHVCLCLSQAGFATAYIIFIAANLKSIGLEWHRASVCFACVPGLAWLVQFQDLKHLSPFSLLANCSNFAALSAVLFQDWKTYHLPDNNDNTVHAVQWDGLLYICAITLYSIEGVGMVLSLEASCQDRPSFPKFLRLVGSGIAVFMAFFGAAGYLAFGAQTMAPITLNLAGHWSSTFVKCALCLGLYLTYPIMMFPVWATMESLVPRLKKEASLLRRSVRCSVVLGSALIAYSFPDFGEFLSLLGSSICTILGLILPCYFSLRVQWDDSPYWKIGLNIVLFVGGIIFGLFGTYNSFKDMYLSSLTNEAAQDDPIHGGG